MIARILLVFALLLPVRALALVCATTDIATWEAATWASCGGSFPGAGDTATIQSPGDIQVPSGTAALASAVTVETGATLDLDEDLTVSGTFTCDGNLEQPASAGAGVVLSVGTDVDIQDCNVHAVTDSTLGLTFTGTGNFDYDTDTTGLDSSYKFGHCIFGTGATRTLRDFGSATFRDLSCNGGWDAQGTAIVAEDGVQCGVDQCILEVETAAAGATIAQGSGTINLDRIELISTTGSRNVDLGNITTSALMRWDGPGTFELLSGLTTGGAFSLQKGGTINQNGHTVSIGGNLGTMEGATAGTSVWNVEGGTLSVIGTTTIGDTQATFDGSLSLGTGGILDTGILVYDDEDGFILGGPGAHVFVNTSTTAATTDWFASKLSGNDANDGTDHPNAVENWAAAMGLGDHTDDHILFHNGQKWDVGTGDVTFQGGGTVGAYGRGTTGWGPKSLWMVDANAKMEQTGSVATTFYYLEMSWGDFLNPEIFGKRTSCVAPCGLRFDARNTDHTLLNDSEDYVDLSYRWRYGEPASGNWARGARSETTEPASKNEDYGPVGAHFYLNPGRYLVEMEACDADECKVAHQPVTIISPQVEWPDEDTYCFSTGSDFSGCPIDTDHDGDCDSGDALGSVAADHCVTTSDFDHAMEDGANCQETTKDCCNIDGDGHDRCLFKRGDTFTQSDPVDVITTTDDWMIGAFGDPDLGQFNVTNANSLQAFTTEGGGTDIAPGRIMDIHVTGNDLNNNVCIEAQAAGTSGVECSGREIDNLLIYNVTCEDTDTGIQFRGNTANFGGVKPFRPECNHDDVFIIDTQVFKGGGQGGVDMFPMGDGIVVMGSHIGDRDGLSDSCTNHCRGLCDVVGGQCLVDSDCTPNVCNNGLYPEEHNTRFKQARYSLLAHNDHGNHGFSTVGGCGANRSVLTIRDGMAENMGVDGEAPEDVALAYTAYNSLYDLDVRSCKGNAWILQFGQTDADNTHEFHHSNVFDGSAFSSLESDGSTSRQLMVFGSFNRVRNSVFDQRMTAGGLTSIAFDDRTNAARTIPQQSYAIGNSILRGDGTAINFTGAIDCEDCLVANTLIHDDGTGGNIIDSSTRTICCGVECGTTNPGACNEVTVSNPFDGSFTGLTAENIASFKIAATRDLGLDLQPEDYTDAFGSCRHASTPDSGAFESGSTTDSCLLQPNDAVNVLNNDSAMGVNLHRNRHWESQLPWANAMKMGRPWQRDSAGGCDFVSAGTYAGQLDDLGYPLDGLDGNICVFTEIFRNTFANSDWHPGTWVLLFEGTATPVVGGSASALLQDTSYTGTGSRYTFTVGETGSGIDLGFTSLTSLSNMRIYPPGGVCATNATAPHDFEPWSFCDAVGTRCDGDDCEGSQACTGSYTQCVDLELASEGDDLLFHPRFLSTLRRFRTLRLMDWGHTNSSFVKWTVDWTPWGYVNWNYEDQSRRPGIQSLGNPGTVPPVVQVAICDAVGAECWFNIPHQVSDSEIQRLGRLCRDNTSLTCYFEYSNETWNGTFAQATDITALAVADDAGFSACAPSQPAQDDQECRDAYHSKRTIEMCALLEGVFAETGEASRLGCVMGSQASSGNTVFVDRLDCAKWTGNGEANCYTNTDIDFVAVAPYFGIDSGDGAVPPADGDCDGAHDTQADGVTVANLCNDGNPADTDSLRDWVDVRYHLSTGQIDDHFDQMSSRSVTWPVLAYEGGTGWNDATSNSGICLDVVVNTCAKTEYQHALDAWKLHCAAAPTGNDQDIRLYVNFDHISNYNEASGEGKRNGFGLRGSWLGVEASWPKVDGVLTWDAANPCWWSGCALDGTTPGGCAAAAPDPGTGGGGWSTDVCPIDGSETVVSDLR